MLSHPVTPTQITRGQRLWLYGLVTLIALFLVIPCILVIPMSFSAGSYLEFPPRALSLRWYEAFLGSTDWRRALFVSLKAAALTTVVATALGTAAAWGIQRLTGGFGKGLRGIFMLPMLVPLILIAIGLFFVYGRIGLNGTLLGLVLAHTMLAIPFVVIAVGNGLASFDMSQHMVARSLGASEIRAFVTVTLPQVKISVLSGAVFAFITSFDEVVVGLFIASGRNETLARRMFANIRDQIDPTVAAISSLLVGMVIIGMVVFTLIQPKEKG